MTSYPTEYELDVVIKDGDVVHIRPIRPDDKARHRGFIDLLGRESRFFRFFQAKETLSDEETEYFVNVDYEDRMALIVLDGERMIAVGRYDRHGEQPDTAQVAFAVADEYQGRGIGTSLLQLLTAHARQNGIERFTADVLAENVRMIRVFRNAGYELKRTLDQGVYSVDFPVQYTEGARVAAEDRERRAVAASVLPLFFPTSIAVVGASTRRGAIGNTLFKNLISTGFNGAVYPVNPKARVVESVWAYPSVLHVPERIDLAFIVVPSQYVIEAVRECGEAGVRGVVVISAGFAEVGNTEMEHELLEVVRSYGMRMVGPNCMGLLNTSDTINMNGTFAPVYPPKGNIAMSSQSGALGIAILEFARRNALGISQFISVGNKADVVGSDLLALWEDDPQTDVILFYLESFGNPRRFTRLARRVARKKPILAVKSGRTGAGSRAASSHTGALASRDIAVDALFEEAGVMRVDTLESMFGLASLLANQPVPKGRRVGIVTNAGGPAILAADALEGRGLELPALSDDLRARIGEHLPAEASTANPIDMIAGAGPDEYRASLEGLLYSGEVDTVMVLYVPTSAGGEKTISQVVREVAEAYDGETTLVAVFMQVAEASEYLRGETTTVPVYQFPEDAAVALEKAVRYGEWLDADPGEVPKMDGVENDRAKRLMAKALKRLGPDGGWLEPKEVTELLGLHGIRVPKEAVVSSEEDAVAAAAEIGGPVVLKVIAASALHKSDIGGIALDLETEEEVREAYRVVSTAVDDVDGVLVQEMIRGGHEVLVGVTEDPNFGPLIVYGLGGIMVEVMQDVTFKLWPLTDVGAAQMVDGIRGAKLLRGYRNLPEGDIEGVQDILLRVSAMVGVCPEISEMDLNPVKVLEPGDGVVAVDARIRVRPANPGNAPELADLPAVVNARLPRQAD